MNEDTSLRSLRDKTIQKRSRFRRLKKSLIIYSNEILKKTKRRRDHRTRLVNESREATYVYVNG